MRAFLTCTVLSLISKSFGAGIVQYEFHKVRKQRETFLEKRATIVAADLFNENTFYIVTITIGTPPQSVQMQIGTGSSDTWVINASASDCQQNACEDVSYNPAQSSSYDALQTVFNISYQDGTGSSGIYFTDTLSIGNTSLAGMELALANVTSIDLANTGGIMGLSFVADEAVCRGSSPCPTYPTILDQMVTQGKILSHTFSLWLNDLQASTGSVLFGGIDTGKYLPPMLSVPIEQGGSAPSNSFSVAFTGLTVTNPINASLNTIPFTQTGFTATVVLEASTTLTYVPDSLFTLIQAHFGVVNGTQSGIYLYEGDMDLYHTTLNFQFGGSGGPVINAPLVQFMLPYKYDNGSSVASNGNIVYEFGIAPGGNEFLLFGDTFLHNAYVVYDLENLMISLANTNFDSEISNAIAIPAGSAGVQGVLSTIVAASTSTAATSTTPPTSATTSYDNGPVDATSYAISGNSGGVTNTVLQSLGPGPVSTGHSGSAAASPTSGASRTQGHIDGTVGFVAWIGTLSLFMLGFVLQL